MVFLLLNLLGGSTIEIEVFSMQIIIPQHPKSFDLSVTHLWNGSVCPDERIRASVSLSQVQGGISVCVEAPVLHEQHIPDAPIGSRIADLWNYDVVEVFFVGPGHEYLELELGAGGHWLLLGFDRIRHTRDSYTELKPGIQYKKTLEKTWVSEIVVPWEIIPENLRGLNAFVIASGQFLAYTLLPGAEPDFHQPDFYPSARLA